jgi:hypothetical protein
MSAETRAIVSQPDVETIADISIPTYENVMYTYNLMREFLFYPNNQPYFGLVEGLDGCNDCRLLLESFITYQKNIKGQTEPEIIGSMIRECLKYFGRTLTNKEHDHHGSLLTPFKSVDHISLKLSTLERLIPKLDDVETD